MDANSKSVLLQADLNHDLLLHKVANSRSDKSCLTKLNPSHSIQCSRVQCRLLFLCFFSKELLMNTLQFFTPQNYHIAIIHLHVIFKRIESSEKLRGTVQMCSTTIPKKGGKRCSRLCESTETFSEAQWMFLLP